MASRASSTKTRIETGDNMKRTIDINASRASSTKTRIETRVVSLDIETTGSSRASSTKTRIETQVATDQQLPDQAIKSKFHENKD